MADADVSAGAGEAFRPLSGGHPHVEVGQLPPDMVEASPAAKEARESWHGSFVAEPSSAVAGAMGIPAGMGRTIMNLSAMVIIAGIAIGMVHFFMTVFREDRAAHREDINALRDDSAKKWEVMRDVVTAVKDNQTAIIGLADLVKEGRKTTETLTGAVKDLTAEVRKNTAEVRKRFPAGPVPVRNEDDFEQGLNKPLAVPEKKSGG